MSRGLVCAAIAWAHTHPAEGLMRRLVEASRVRILRLSVAGPGGLVESRPELHMELVMTTRGCSWIPIGNKAVNPKLAESAPNTTRWGDPAAMRRPLT